MWFICSINAAAWELNNTASCIFAEGYQACVSSPWLHTRCFIDCRCHWRMFIDAHRRKIHAKAFTSRLNPEESRGETEEVAQDRDEMYSDPRWNSAAPHPVLYRLAAGLREPEEKATCCDIYRCDPLTARLLVSEKPDLQLVACGWKSEGGVCGGGGGRQSSQKTFLIAFGLKRISWSTNFSTAPVCWSPPQTSSCLLGFIYCSLRLQAPPSQQGRPCLMCATQTLGQIFFLCDPVVEFNTRARHCSVGDGMLQ